MPTDHHCAFLGSTPYHCFLPGRIDRASSLENVEEIWREVEEKGIVPDDTLRQTYTNRKLELKQNHPKQL